MQNKIIFRDIKHGDLKTACNSLKDIYFSKINNQRKHNNDFRYLVIPEFLDTKTVKELN